MHREILLLSALLMLMAEEPAPPQLTAVFSEANVAMRAEWKGMDWVMTRDDVSLSLSLTATCLRPVLRVEILRFDELSDSAGTDLRTKETNRLHRDRGRWWDAPDSTDLTTLTFNAYTPIDRPEGRPASIARIRGLARVTIAQGEVATFILPIDGAQRQIQVGDSGLAIEVGRKAWGGRPVLGVPKALTARLRSLTFQSGGRSQCPSGINEGEPNLITLPLEPRTGDTVSLGVYPGVEIVEIPFTLGPVDLAPLLGDQDKPAMDVEF